ncbi:hypothetical protein BGZ46_008823 [Entomortierella lignicola]|nr:hypothetical protein BGZ46_008823 [Entomortierella lignicola]
MTTTRRSSRTSTAAATAAADPKPAEPTQDSAPTEQSAKTMEDPAVESESSQIKEDHKLETTNSDPSKTTESETTEEPLETAGTESTETKETTEESKEPTNSIHLAGHIKGVPGQVNDSDATREQLMENHNKVMSESNNLTTDAAPNQPTETVPQSEGVEIVKHPKRAVEDDSNTAEEQDYTSGAYKSPFRHPIEKVEKEGQR